jgi:hypothetical protein
VVVAVQCRRRPDDKQGPHRGNAQRDVRRKWGCALVPRVATQRRKISKGITRVGLVLPGRPLTRRRLRRPGRRGT